VAARGRRGRDLRSVAAEVRGAAVYLAALRSFLAEPLSFDAAAALVRRQHETREATFLELLERSVFAHARSPYRPLLAHAGIEHGDLVRLVREEGAEGALACLYDEGVRIGLDELRGHVPIRRGGLELRPRAEDFDNPLAGRHYAARSGGSRSGRIRVPANLEQVAHEAAYTALFHRFFGVETHRTAIWYPAPPGIAGLKHALRHAKVGRPVERWYSQTDPGLRGESLRYALFTRATVRSARLFGRGRPIPAPEHVTVDEAARVARWAAEARRAGTPASLWATSSSAVRVCRAAAERGLDIAGTFVRVGGEPYTAARAAIVEAAGCRGVSNYYVNELGGIAGKACVAPEHPDEVHLVTDKLAVLQRPRTVGAHTVGALVFTALHRLSPKVVINLESDDFGVLGRRDCGCGFQRVGLPLHLHGIRSYLKLTSEGMSFLGEDAIDLVERVLPRRFGGSATDYQLVEREEGGLPRIAVVVSPRVALRDERDVVETVLGFLRQRGEALTAEVWGGGGTLQVLRRDPYETAASKLPAVHVLDGRVV
jgi:hypothetical protein